MGRLYVTYETTSVLMRVINVIVHIAILVSKILHFNFLPLQKCTPLKSRHCIKLKLDI